MSRRGTGSLRIVAGRWRGRRIHAPRGDRTRPASDLHRESVGNALSRHLAGATVLDLFAGSGALAFECLSRGAARAVVLDTSPQALETIRRNAEQLGVTSDEITVLRADAYKVGELPGGPFPIVLVAPPYPHFLERRIELRKLLEKIGVGERRLLAPGGIVVVQSEVGTFAGGGLPGLQVERERRYGRTSFCYLQERAPIE